MESFNQFADSLDISFTCPHCKNEISYSIESLPSPDWSGDTAASSENYDDDEFFCEHCGRGYIVDIYVNIVEGNIIVRDSETYEEIDSVHIDEHLMDEDEFESEE